ncbi:alpha/beta hydrolase family esterase [Streptomyces poriticola]|uniref:alpha/beta hydrolase family esterase n=1 Tax=Streptomyces poriticola TaxID=3120506 RepID=UPI002FCE299B
MALPQRSRTGGASASGVLAAVLALLLVGCGGSAADRGAPHASASQTALPHASAPESSGAATAAPDRREQLRVDGRTRNYLLHRPAETAAGRGKPLVIAFHGRGSTPAELRERSRFEADARARGMLIAYPEGLRKGWGAGTRATAQRPDPDLDVRFTEALVAHLVRTEGADPERVYAVGFSNGGSMALRMAAERPALLAGAASVSGQLPSGDAAVEPTGPVPVMVVYGADDPVRPLSGWASPPARADEPITPTRSARATAEAFAAAGGAGEPVTERERGYDRTVWRPTGRGGAEVELLVVHDAGHTWPGSDVTPPEGFGPTSQDLDATAAILGFLTGGD